MASEMSMVSIQDAINEKQKCINDTEMKQTTANNAEKRSFVCHICNESFDTKESLNIHVLSHSKIISQIFEALGNSLPVRDQTSFIDKIITTANGENILQTNTSASQETAISHDSQLEKCNVRENFAEDINNKYETKQTNNNEVIETKMNGTLDGSKKCSLMLNQQGQLHISLSKDVSNCFEKNNDSSDQTDSELSIKSTEPSNKSSYENDKITYPPDKVACTKSKNSYLCKVCGLKCPHACHLKVHMRIHTNERPYSCSLCRQRFRRRGDGNKHLRIVHNRSNTNLCVETVGGHPSEYSNNSEIKDNKILDERTGKMHETLLPNSPATELTLKNAGELKRHTENGQKEACSIDIVEAHSQHETSSKQLEVTVDGSKTCVICSKNFTRPDGLRLHMLIHKGIKPHSCWKCRKMFRQKAHLRRHLKNCRVTNPVGIQTSSPVLYKQGQLISSNSEDVSICLEKSNISNDQTESELPIKSKEPSNKSNCENDKIIYLPGKVASMKSKNSYMCTVCGLKCFHACHLKVHMRIHTNERPYSCSMCRRSFKRRADCNKHLRIVHNKANYNLCVETVGGHASESSSNSEIKDNEILDEGTGKMNETLLPSPSATDNITLKNIADFKGHTENEPQETCSIDTMKEDPKLEAISKQLTITADGSKTCPICFKNFTRPDGLRLHVLIHKGIKPHSCWKCRKMFREKAHLRGHLRNCRASNASLIQTGLPVLYKQGQSLSSYSENVSNCSEKGDDSNDSSDKKLSFKSTEPSKESTYAKDKMTDNPNKVEKALPRKFFYCSVCGLKCSRAHHLKVHMRIHTNERPFGCFICRQTFRRRGDCNKHLRIVHNKSDNNLCIENSRKHRFECSMNSAIEDGKFPDETVDEKSGEKLPSSPVSSKNKSTNKDDLIYQENDEQDTASFLDTDLDKKDTKDDPIQTNALQNVADQSNSDITCVINEEQQNKTYNCHNCGFEANKDRIFKEHLLIHSDDKSWSCSFCTKQFKRKEYLTQHKRMVHSVRKVKKELRCKICPKVFTREKHYQRHLLVHTGEKPDQCPICNKYFPGTGDLKQHMKTHGTKPYACDICGKGVCSLWVLQRHLLTHTGVKPLICEFCGKRFRWENNLKEHLSLHYQLNVFRCDLCNKSLSWKASIRKHTEAHLDIRRYSCSICNKLFRERGHLKEHMECHSTDASLKCNKCGKFFHKTESFKYHMFSHTGATPFSCNRCEKTFKRAENLRTHMLIHDGKKPHRCVTCGNTFRQKISLKLHMKRIHQQT